MSEKETQTTAVSRELIIFHDPSSPFDQPRHSVNGDVNRLKIVVRTFPHDAPNEFTDQTIWVGPDFQEGVSEHNKNVDPCVCHCERCARDYGHLKTRADVAAEKNK